MLPVEREIDRLTDLINQLERLKYYDDDPRSSHHHKVLEVKRLIALHLNPSGEFADNRFEGLYQRFLQWGQKVKRGRIPGLYQAKKLGIVPLCEISALERLLKQLESISNFNPQKGSKHWLLQQRFMDRLNGYRDSKGKFVNDKVAQLANQYVAWADRTTLAVFRRFEQDELIKRGKQARQEKVNDWKARSKLKKKL